MATPSSLYRQLPAMRRRSRRIAVIGAFTGFPLLLIGYEALVATGRLSSIVWGPIAIALFAATLIGAVAIYGYGQNRMDRERLDERERRMVDQALVVSYAVLTTVIVAIAAILAIYLSFVGPLEIDMGVVTPWFVAIGLYVPLLPFAALAWIEPDAPADDER
jgi:hypothetical protein